MQEALSNRLKTVGDYKHGSIKRIKLSRFLTYNSVEFSPGPRLNMVVGPNGSGKSSILCAICLGLGGEPRLLGRADKVESFIQNGETEAEIELEVTNERGDDVVVTRTISQPDPAEGRSNKNSKTSIFTWNGEVISGKKVRERASQQFQIQLDNLCTFLPQEKVGNFSGISSKELLLETEKTLSDNQDLYDTHMKLIKMQEDLQGGDNQVDNLKDKVKHLEEDVKRYKVGVDRMEERKKAEEQADLLRKKIMWLEVDSTREKCLELRKVKEAAKQKVEELDDAMEPLERAHNDARERLERAKKEAGQFDKQMKKHEDEMKKQKGKFEIHDDDIETTLVNLSSIDSRRANMQSHVQNLREKVDEVQGMLDQVEPVQEIEARYAEARKEQDNVRSLYNQKKSALQDLKRKIVSVDEELSTERRKLDRLQNEKEQRRKHVLGKFQNVKQSYDWIQNNRNLFRKEVIGPIACEISPKSSKFAAFLEQHVPNATLKSFVVQNKSDYDLLYQKIRVEQSIPINIIQVDRISSDGSRIFSDQKIAMLKQDHGVVGYLDETFEGPDIIVEALRANASIHKVLVGTDQTQESLDSRGLGDILSESENGGRLQSYCIFTSQREQSFKYTSQISRYSGKASLRVDDIKPASILTRGVSDDAKQKVAEKLREIQERKNQIQPEYDQIARENEELLGQVQNAQENLKDMKQKIQTHQKTEKKLENYKRKLSDAEKQLEGDNEDEKKNLTNKLKAQILGELKAMGAHSLSYKKMMEATVNASGAKLTKEVATVEERTTRAKVEEANAEKEEAVQTFRTAKEQFKIEKNHFKRIQEKADMEAPLKDEDGNDTPLNEILTNELSQFTSVGEAVVALEEAQAKVNDIHADPNVIRLYEEKKAELEEAEISLEDLTTRKEARVSELERMKEPWLETLKKTITTVDKRFTKYMNELGCVGEVSLKHEDDLNFSFTDYAVEIKVSFRKNVAPSVLSSRVQSGGERSVSTIMYLMAMQDMMVSPFRCVDEINQGLDERNERLVFKRIVQNSTKAPGPEGPTDHCGQYWLITPKLLPNLFDMEVAAMNVICIFNGPYTLSNPTDWNTEKLVAIRKRRREELDDDEDDDGNKSPRIED